MVVGGLCGGFSDGSVCLIIGISCGESCPLKSGENVGWCRHEVEPFVAECMRKLLT